MMKRIATAVIIISVVVALGVGIFIGVYEGFFDDIYYTWFKPITFDINDTLPNANGEEAIVIILAGQSNASGCSRDDYLQKNVSEEKYAEYRNGYDNVYIN